MRRHGIGLPVGLNELIFLEFFPFHSDFHVYADQAHCLPCHCSYHCTLVWYGCDDVYNGLDNTCEVIRQETVEVSPVFITSWFYSLPLKLIT